MTIEEWKDDFRSFICELTMPRDDYNSIMEYIMEGYNLFKAQEPRVMALDEVRAAEVVWLEQCNKCVCAIKIRTYANGIISFAYAYNNRVDIINIKPNLYGEICRCWTSRPTDAQMESAPWE